MTTTAKALKITPAAAAANIRKLTAGGVLREATGRKRDQVFVAHEILKFMGKR
jgi:Fic family protein